MRILFVTSFNRALYEATGHRLVRSYLRYRDEGSRLLVCHEGGTGQALPKNDAIVGYPLDQSRLLTEWLAENRDIIPEQLGGLAKACACPGQSFFRNHVEGCHWFWFNKNASRWFRKIVSLDVGMRMEGHDALVWLDSDARLKQRLPASVVEGWFGDASVFCFKSPQRKVMESGVLGVRLDAGGQKFLETTIERYRSGEFRRYERWDDGFHFQVTVNENPAIAVRDLATHKTGGTFVLCNSPAARYLGHDKGVHRRKQVMF